LKANYLEESKTIAALPEATMLARLEKLLG
jgi:hypothetical protein